MENIGVKESINLEDLISKIGSISKNETLSKDKVDDLLENNPSILINPTIDHKDLIDALQNKKTNNAKLLYEIQSELLKETINEKIVQDKLMKIIPYSPYNLWCEYESSKLINKIKEYKEEKINIYKEYQSLTLKRTKNNLIFFLGSLIMLMGFLIYQIFNQNTFFSVMSIVSILSILLYDFNKKKSKEQKLKVNIEKNKILSINIKNELKNFEDKFHLKETSYIGFSMNMLFKNKKEKLEYLQNIIQTYKGEKIIGLKNIFDNDLIELGMNINKNNIEIKKILEEELINNELKKH